MIYLQKIKAFFIRIFRLFSVDELRFLSERKESVYYSEKLYADWEEIRDVADFFKKREKALTILLNYLELSYNGTAKAFFNLLRQAHIDATAKRLKDSEQLKRDAIKEKRKRK